MSQTISITSTLGKRKAPDRHVGVLYLVSSPEPSFSEQSDFEQGSSNKNTTQKKPVLINGKLVSHTKQRYQCTHPGCEKAYTKPSRLAEHERTHTGERPFVCETCQKAYLRETHLHAHARTHLPQSSRPFVCEFQDCEKRFWTSQHLKVHQDWHNGAKPLLCPEDGCSEAFSKHHQLRAHICQIHAPPGRKPYRCDHDGCDKSFDSNQHLKSHKKTHDANRYTCVHLSCLATSSKLPTFFSTWSALQHHIRTDHPPVCTHPSCQGRVFPSQKGLKAHQKLHEQREMEAELHAAIDSDAEDSPQQPPHKKARRGGELGRDWVCDMDGCSKDFKSKKALNTHKNVTHLGKREFVCSECSKSFGYKHLLQRHTAKSHVQESSNDLSNIDSDGDDNDKVDPTSEESDSYITKITGKAYADRARRQISRTKAFRCPFPNLTGLHHKLGPGSKGASTSRPCDHVFSRIYDLRRHLQSSHEILTDKEELKCWIEGHECK